jgi:hypothetical protein
MCLGSGVRSDRVEPEGDGDLHPPAGGAEVGASVLVQLPVHRGRARPEHLHAVHPDVAAPVARVARDHRGERDERRSVTGPARLHGQQPEVDLVAPEDDLLAGPAAHGARRRIRDRLQLPEAAELLAETLRRLHLEHVGERRRRVVQALDAEREAHAPLGAELIDEQPVTASLRVLEQQRGAVLANRAGDDLGDLEVRVDLGRDPDELAFAVEQGDPLAQIGYGHQYERR